MNSLPDDASQIDLLIDGELSPEARRALLARLDASPDGWRRCALAFLEAQAWRESFSEAASEAPAAPPIVAIRPRRLHVAPWLARAAVVLAAFAVGWAVHRPRVEAARTLFVQRPLNPATANHLKPPVPRVVPERPAPSDYALGRLEREGYRVEPTRYLVPAATRDGRRVAVPVPGVRVRFVGNPIL
jgi:hypothetical protein